MLTPTWTLPNSAPPLHTEAVHRLVAKERIGGGAAPPPIRSLLWLPFLSRTTKGSWMPNLSTLTFEMKLLTTLRVLLSVKRQTPFSGFVLDLS